MIYWIFTNALKIIVWIDMIFATAGLWILSLLPKFMTQSWYNVLFRRWCWVFIRALGVTLKIHQKNLHPLPKHFIVIANHPSVFEDLGMPALFNARFVAKKELRDWWILGRISTLIRTLYVERDSKDSRNKTLDCIIEALSKGDNIALYQEGGCKGKRIHLPFRYGIFEASINTGVPIIPVFIHYEAQESFEWRDRETLIHKLWDIMRSRNKTANYYVFDALHPERFRSKEMFCNFVEKLYLQWQEKYLE